MILAVTYLFLLSMSNVIIPLFSIETSTGKKPKFNHYFFILLLLFSMVCLYFFKVHYFVIELIVFIMLTLVIRRQEKISIPYCLAFFVITNSILISIITILYIVLFVGYIDADLQDAFSGFFSESNSELIVKMIYFIILLYIQKNRRKDNHVLDKKHWNLLHSFYAISMVLMFIFMVFIQDMNKSKFGFLFSFIALLIITLLFLFNMLFIWLHKNMLENHYLIMERDQIQFKLDALLERQKHTEDMKKFKHDTQNNFIILNYLLNEKKYEAAIGYLNEYTKNFSELGKYVQIDNLIISAIINDKMKRYPLINFDVRCFVPAKLSINQLDLGTILGNLVDNACEHMDLNNFNETLSIKIVSYCDMDLFIEITNPCINELINHITLLTNKTEKKHHGYGLKNIEKSVETYDGMFLKKIEEGYFIAQVLIPGGVRTA